MNRRISFQNIGLTAVSEYVKWLINPRMILLAVVILPMRDSVVRPLLFAARQMGTPLNVLEPCIATVNSWMGLLLLALTYVLLMAPFPTMDSNMFFYIARMGRRNWILGEMLFQLMSALTYSLFVTFGTAVQVVRESFLADGWSLVVTDYDELYSGAGSLKIGEILQRNLFFQMSPYKAYLLSFGLFSLFLLFCGMLFLTGGLHRNRLLFFLFQVLHIILGFCMILLNSNAMWFFPLGHALLAYHFREYFRAYVFSPYLSLVILAALSLFLAVVMYRKAGRVSLDEIGGIML